MTIWVLGTAKEKDLLPSETRTPTIDWSAIGTPSASASYVYKDNSDYSATALSGSNNITGNVATGKTVTAGANDGGTIYVYIHEATIGGLVYRQKFQINIGKLGGRLYE